MAVIETAVFIVVNGIIFGSLLALTAVGLSLIFGVLGVPNFAQGEFAAVAGFTVVGLLGHGFGLLTAVLAGLVVTFVLGVASERLVIAKLYGRDNFLLLSFFATFGLTLISESALRILFGGFSRIEGPSLGSITVLGFELSLLRVTAGVTAVCLLVALYLFTRYTYMGLAMRAVANDRHGAEMIGIDFDRISTVTFGTGALLSGVSGVLYGMLFTIYPTLGVSLTAFAFTIVVVGTTGSFIGVIVASLIIGIVDSFTATVVGSEYRIFAVFLVLFVVLTLKPGGLWGDHSVNH
ncbi:branched-chain amino acid ABC transporter permease [Natrinema gelatinilyticum]|uniref:branched-chain amino acid ABC transporter permease n=1 Tax=Natrinema gelatinilyticum TaxID=2961571 RepID=UPI0020C1C5C2|nr:branched-chain amino acid ABC transporter permease [Natrinema gelatinilyticum]